MTDSVFNTEKIELRNKNVFKKTSIIESGENLLKEEYQFGLYLTFSDTLYLYYCEVRPKFMDIDSNYIVEIYLRTVDSMVMILKDSFLNSIPYSENQFSFASPFIDSIYTPKMTYFSKNNYNNHNMDSSNCYIDSTTLVKEAFNILKSFGSHGWCGGVVSNCGPLPMWIFPDQTSIFVGVCEDRIVRNIEVYPLRKGKYSLKTSRPLLILNKIRLCSFEFQKVFINKQKRFKYDSEINSKFKIIKRLKDLNITD